MYETKIEDISEDFRNDKEMFDFSNHSIKSNCHDNSKKLVVDKIKNEAADAAIEEFFGLKPKMYSFGKL